MTYEELRQDVARLLSQPALERDPFLMAQAELAIRLANEEVARHLRVPSVSATITPDSQGVVAWPSGAFGGREGISHILYKDQDVRRLPLITLEESYVRYPSWESKTGTPQFVIFDPQSRAYGIRIVPYDPSLGGTFVMRYIKIPAKMDSPLDEPLDGELPQYHNLISLNAAIRLLEYDYSGGESADYIGFTNIRKIEMYKRDYQVQLLDAIRKTQISVMPVRNPFWSIQ